MLGGLLGGGISIFGHALDMGIKYFEAKERNAHELQMLDRQGQIQQNEIQGKIQIAESANIAQDNIQITKSNTELTLKASQWVINIASLVRPYIAIFITTLIGFLAYKVIQVANIKTLEDAQRVITVLSLLYIGDAFLMIIGAYFGDRVMRRARGMK